MSKSSTTQAYFVVTLFVVQSECKETFDCLPVCACLFPDNQSVCAVFLTEQVLHCDELHTQDWYICVANDSFAENSR